MPYTESQRKLFFADMARAKKGQKTRTGIGADKLSEMAHAPLKKKNKNKKKNRDYLAGE